MHLDPYNLERFVLAQENGIYEQAYKELRSGRKAGHYMWFIFPQLKGLGTSLMADTYGITGKEEAICYLTYPPIGQRLIYCTKAVNTLENKTIYQIFPTPDELKFFSSMTLFAEVSGEDSVFNKALNKYFSGKRDLKTISMLEKK